MKRQNIYKFLYVMSALLVVGFAIRLGVDAYQYDKLLHSAPFYIFVIFRIIEFILPSIIIFVAATIVKKKYGIKEDNDK